MMKLKEAGQKSGQWNQTKAQNKKTPILKPPTLYYWSIPNPT